MTTTDDARLVEIEAREQAATPGPWRAGIDVVRWSDYDVETKAYCWEALRPDDERPDGFGECEDADDCEGHDLNLALLCDVSGPEHLTPTEDSGYYLHEKDADFIAHSREDVRYLLDRLKEAESRIRELEGALTASRDFFESGRFIRVEGAPITALRDKIALALQSVEIQEEGNGG